MAQKKDDLPVNVDVDLKNGGTITYATEVISTIAGVAANEIEGIAGMCISGGLSDIIGRNRNITRGVKVEMGSEEASFDLYLIVEYGQPIQKVCHDVQENVRKAIESMTGLHVVRVDVHVQGVSFEKEKKAQAIGIEASRTPALAAGRVESRKDKAAHKKAQEPVKTEKAEAEKETAEKAAPEAATSAVQPSEKPTADAQPAPEAPETETPKPKAKKKKKTAEEAEKVRENVQEKAPLNVVDASLDASDEGEKLENAVNDSLDALVDEAKQQAAEAEEEAEEAAIEWKAGPAAGGSREAAVKTDK